MSTTGPESNVTSLDTIPRADFQPKKSVQNSVSKHSLPLKSNQSNIDAMRTSY